MEICQFLLFQNEVFFAKNFADVAINWCKDCLMLLTCKFVRETIKMLKMLNKATVILMT